LVTDQLAAGAIIVRERDPLMRGAPMGERRGKVVLPSEATEAIDEARALVRETKARSATRLSAGDILTLLRHHDIPCSIDSFAAKGWTVRLGDPGRGFYAQEGRFPTIEAAANWLLEEARRQYPGAMPDSER
jgi:hypothetical protein